MKLFMLETLLLTSILPSLLTVDLFCPTGKTFQAEPEEAMAGFERDCQCQGGALCRYSTHSLGCSSLLGTLIENRFHHLKSACIIHDICYGSLKPGRSQEDCDLEFKHNLIKLCRPMFATEDPEGTCQDMAFVAHFIVSWTGYSYVTPNPEPQCNTQITTPCWRPRLSSLNI